MNSLAELIPVDYALQNNLVPLSMTDQLIIIAMLHPDNREITRELEFFVDRNILPVKWELPQIQEEINRLYQISDAELKNYQKSSFHYLDSQKEIRNDLKKPEDHTVVDWLDELISEAIIKRASDIHLESYEDSVKIRFRIDGILTDWGKSVNYRGELLISRLKIMAHLDIAERRRPQDGRFTMQNGKNAVDIRLSTLPTVFGEKIVLRILDKSNLNLSLENLGFNANLVESLQKILNFSYGMILVTGPTGSGKTTTLYSALQFLNRPEVNIITVEDPIEYFLPGINQTNVKPPIGLTFANLLKNILRQDPDIIMVGEIRDRETAEIAIRAALTGHLVLSTLHTNNALSTIVRLIDMGIETFLLASALKMVISQRLVRKICSECKIIDKSENDLMAQTDRFTANQIDFYRGQGCRDCNYTGYSGRIAVAEYIQLDEDIITAIQKFTGLSDLQSIARKKGFIPLKEAAFQKCIEGITSLPEVISEIITI